MTSETLTRIAFLVLLAVLLIMRVYFIVKVRRSGARLLPDEQAAQREGPDPETERKAIRNTIRLMRENYERALYKGEEYQYWQNVSALKEELDLLSRLPEPAIERATRTLLDLRESWEWATKEERKDLTRMMIQEVGVNVEFKHVLWVKARPDYEPLFSILDGMRQDAVGDFG